MTYNVFGGTLNLAQSNHWYRQSSSRWLGQRSAGGARHDRTKESWHEYSDLHDNVISDEFISLGPNNSVLILCMESFREDW